MSQDGILVTIFNINPLKRQLLIKPNVTTRGFILVNENTELISTIEKKVQDIVTNYLSNNTYNYVDLRNTIILELHPFISKLTGRRPIILPVIMEVKKAEENYFFSFYLLILYSSFGILSAFCLLESITVAVGVTLIG